VLRRILRRAISYGNRIGLEDDFLVKLVPALSKMFEGVFPELKTQQDIIVKVLTGESKSFGATLSGGNALFEMSVVAGKDRDRSLEIAEKLQELAASWAGSESDYLSHTKEDRSELRMLTIALSGTNIMRNLGKAGVTAQGRANQLALLEMGQPLGEIVAAGEQHRLARAKLLLRETIEALKDVPASGRQISGQVAFLLHDTFGFPLDLTQLMAQRINMDVDVAGFDRLMDEQKARAKAAQKKQIIRIGDSGVAAVEPTEFIGYEHYTRRILAEIRGLNSSPKEASVAVDKTPFYAEMGGQVSDTGTLIFKQQLYKVTNVTKVANVFIHALDRPLKDGAPYTELAGQEVELHVNFVHRAKIEAHHSGTHLMHWALRKVLGTTVSQKGSYVGPDRLRFDFSHGTAMTPEEIAEVERLVNEQIAADVPVAWDERPYAQVKGDPSILQFFGDKYGETVRVVSIGDFSKELCGGTHVRHTQQVGYFKILHESAIAAGIRRIEAMSGEALRVHLKELIAKQVIDGAGTTSVGIEVSTPELWSLYKSREKQLHDLELARIQNEKDAAKKQESEFQKRAATEAPELIAAAKDIHGVPFLAKQIDAPAAYLPLLADALKARWQGVAVLAVADAATGKAALLAAVAPAFTKKVQAGKIIQAIAPLVGGKGGGRPELAQGGGTNPAGIPDALAKAEELLRAA
jgi:alanyl-tRNA synthetase